jgi:acetyl esterase/lipase
LEKFTGAFLPNISTKQIKDPSISPYYKDLVPLSGKLPSVFFTCGTEDTLLDDSIYIYIRWLNFGGKAIIKFYPSACYEFINFPPAVLDKIEKALKNIKTYI